MLVYRPARTVVVADLVHNIGRPQQRWTKIYTRTMGFYDRVALSRVIRWAAFRDRAAARRSVKELLAHPFDRLVVGHGTPLAAAEGRLSLPPTLGCCRRAAEVSGASRPNQWDAVKVGIGETEEQLDLSERHHCQRWIQTELWPESERPARNSS